MATILGLALKINADASGVQKALTPVERALQQLDQEAAKVTSVFDNFARSSGAAADVQRRFESQTLALTEALKSGEINGRQFADGFAAVKDSAMALADTFAEGARVTEQYRSEEERRAETLQRLSHLLDAGAISEETYARASAEASGANEAAARADQARAAALASAARVIQANLTPQERYDQQIQELRGHLEEGRISQETFNRALARAGQDLTATEQQAKRTDTALEGLNRNVGILSTIEIGRTIVSGLQVLGNTFTSATSQITSLVANVNASLDSLVDFSARTGIGVEALQGYSLAAKLAGVDTEQFGTAVQRLAINVGKATPGGDLDKALRGINLSVAELRALSPERQFSAIGDAISQLPTAADRAAASVEVFGKQGGALAPLFREGADSIEELRDRAERLGVIVDQTQIDNVASMNDAFDLVSATVNGIVGQVIGNLAPAVTDVTNEFLKFVEEFAGAEGQGGTGIANKITDVLISGAEVLARVFDDFVGQFGGFSNAFETTATIFEGVGNAITAVSESLRAVFNAFELAGNAIALALGKFLEAIGSWVNDDLEAFGRSLVGNAQQAFDRNTAELEAAAKNAAAAGGAIIGLGEDPAAAGRRGAGAAEEYVQQFRANVEAARAPEFRIEASVEKAQEQFDAFFNGIVDQESIVTAAMRDFEAATAAVLDPMNATEEEIKRIEEAQTRITEAIDAENEGRRQAAEIANQQVAADTKRVEALLGIGNAAAKVEQDILAVQREQERVAGELAAARQVNDTEAGDAAAARLAQLDQLQASLSEQQQAAEQGFGDGFVKAFEASRQSIDALIVKAEQFGNSGAIAAQQLQQGIAQAQEQVRDGILTRETYEREVAQQRDVFEQRLQAAQRVEEFLRNGIDARQQAELDAVKELEERKRQAAINAQAIEAKLIEERRALEAARESGDLRAARAAQARVTTLERAQRSEQALADGRLRQQNEIGQQFLTGLNSAQQFQGLVAQSNENFLRAFSNTYAGANASLAASSAAAAEQAAKLERLLTPTNQLASTADIRTQEGQQLLLDVANQGIDPRLVEARLQTKQLNRIAEGIGQAASNYFNSPVAIVGGAVLG